MTRRVTGCRRASFEPDAHERVGTYEGTSYRFDRAGNLIERQDERGELSMRWDANQRLSSEVP